MENGLINNCALVYFFPSAQAVLILAMLFVLRRKETRKPFECILTIENWFSSFDILVYLQSNSKVMRIIYRLPGTQFHFFAESLSLS